MGRKKPRKKKCRDKWSALHFVPLDVINYKSSRGRIGLKIYKDLLCKICDAVGHTRNSLKLHNDIYHRRDSGPSPPAPALVRRMNTAKNKYKKRKTTVLCTVDLDDDTDDTEEEEESEIVIDCGESMSKNLQPEKNDEEIEILEDEVAAAPVTRAKASTKNKDFTDLLELAKSSLFQPEVSLWNGLSKAIKKANVKSPSPGLNRTYTKKYCDMKDKLVSVMSSSVSKEKNKKVGKLNNADVAKIDKEDEILLLDLDSSNRRSKEDAKNKESNEILLLETPRSNKNATKNNKRPLSSSLKKSVHKLLDWSSIIQGKNSNEKSNMVEAASPARKKPFKPVSLLDKFNDSSTRDDSGYGSPSPITAKNPPTPPRPQIRVRDFANTLHEPDVSTPDPDISVLIDEDDANNSTSQMFMDIVSSPTILKLGKKKQKTFEDCLVFDKSGDDNDVSIVSAGDVQEITPTNISVIQHAGAKSVESDDDIIVEDNSPTVIVRKVSDINSDSSLSPKSQSANFLDQLQSFSQRKFTSTPKTTKPATGYIQIVDIL